MERTDDAKQPARCGWASNDPLYVAYHDTEWGVPVHDDTKLFEFILLDSMQAGLSWLTILKKRENFRKAFAGFDPGKIAKFGGSRIEALMEDAGIVRNRAKIESAVKNAKAFLKIRREFGSFDAYIWSFMGGRPRRNSWKTLGEIPPKTVISDIMSRELKRRGFSFVGTTICYAFMQAAGLVNDHLVTCFRHGEV